MKLLTIFTAPKPFVDPHIAMIQRNAIQSWCQLGDAVDVMLMGDELGIADAARKLGVRHVAALERNKHGTPLISAVFSLAQKQSTSPLLAYINADILVLPDFLTYAVQAFTSFSEFLVVGQRWDLDITQSLDFTPGWENQLLGKIYSKGSLHPPGGSDYFIFARGCFRQVHPFAVGRAGWDNWMIFEARCQKWPVIDATHAIQIVHQRHDYSHLPGGRPHYRSPESAENIRFAGGNRSIFTLHDADYRFLQGKVRFAKWNWRKFWREVEIYPLIHWHSNVLGWLFYAVLHPVGAYGELRKWLALRKGTRAGGEADQ